ncbi:MAG: exodeoxyribonuclease VII small subunit [Roseburia sp.]
MSEKKDQTPTLEESFAKIEKIIEQMEGADVSLDESFRLYQQGISQLKACNGMLDQVEKKMQILNAEGALEEL